MAATSKAITTHSGAGTGEAEANCADDPVETLAIASDPSGRECYPCGQCRQVMVDVERRQGSPMRVIMSGHGSATVVASAALLLPFTFSL